MTRTGTTDAVSREALDRRWRDLGVDDWSDARLVREVGERIAVPREEPADSFVLHAPLELLARTALLGRVRPHDRDRARRQIVSLLVRYEAKAPMAAQDAAAATPGAADPARRLLDAVAAGDLIEADRLTRVVTHGRSAGDVPGAVVGPVLPLLAAAGHAPIFFFLGPRVAPHGELPGALLRPLVRELARAPELRIGWIDGPDRPGTGSVAALATALRDAPHLGEPGSSFIFPLMHQVDASGLAAELVGPAVAGLAAEVAGPVLTRHAARAMILADPAQAPYGWSHCLTLAQAALGVAGHAGTSQRAVDVAATYVLGFLAGEATAPVPDAVELADPGGSFGAAVLAGPTAAAGHVLHRPAGVPWDEIVSRAAVRQDAHLVKYVLASLDAAAADPPAAVLHGAAAAYLLAWWEAAGEPAYPLCPPAPLEV